MLGNTTAALSQIQNTLRYFYSSPGVSAQIKTDLARRGKADLKHRMFDFRSSRKRTFTDTTAMSALCQKRKFPGRNWRRQPRQDQSSSRM
jgi:hypothetical protein